jgi:hypothetical protein
MNGLPALAESLAARGRNGDSMLVHMTPGEVKGLQALALSQGGSLSINPDTGLVEANFLKRLLPMLAGAALTIGSGGVINPMTAGMIVGGGTAVATGDLSKGLMAGLGAYGGAGLGSGFGAAGAAAPGAAVPNIAGGAGAAELASVGQTGYGMTGPMTPTIGQNFAQAGRGFADVFSGGPTGEVARTAFMGDVGGGMGLAKSGMSAAAPLMQAEPLNLPEAEDPYANYKGPVTPSARQVSYPDEDFRRRRTSEFTYFTPSNPVPYAEGGSVPQLEDGGFVLTKQAVDGLGAGNNNKGQQVASRGLGAIPIKGPGTGTSDSIKTSIEGKQPALVSNGEAYVPAKKVKENGGAKAFYALMRRAEKAA